MLIVRVYLASSLCEPCVIPPDLFVIELTREGIEKTIADLLSKGDLEDILNPSVLERKG